ncbi:hypothetical protein CK203_090038 [Vitis vinifera]|uniref:Reverse transcriptase domain-containing protein n=1 Tax=Vitis vinifera TaxID=29760 RepID=A0A438DY37_VITVI|nr:hypothetical protein CK203_090038 [Vitis vinifera]
MGENCGSSCLFMGSNHLEKDRGGVWGFPCNRLPNREARRATVGADPGPILKVGPAGLRGVKTAVAVEVGGEARARANKRVMEMGGVTRLEALQQLVDGTRDSLVGRIRDGPRPKCRQWCLGWVTKDLGPSSEACPLGWTGPRLLKGPDAGISSFWLKSKQEKEEPCLVESPKTDGALLEEAQRYGNTSSPCGLLEVTQRESQCCIVNGLGSIEQGAVANWELMEANNGSNGEGGGELCLVHTMPQEDKGWEEVDWEDSELARFSKFLGFSTKGLEKDILDFLGEEAEEWYARKRGSDVGSLMKLRLLIWNVRGANDSSKRKGVVRSLGSGRFLDWGAMDAHGSAGGVLICWDKRTLEVIEMEVGQFSISCRLRNVEDRFVWIFTGVYGPFSREDKEVFWEELGAIRGIWSDPWLSRPTSDHFPIILKGGGLRRGPSPFRFENMWLKVDGFKDLLREWWQGTVVSGKASFRLASGLKVLKQKIKDWNREVFGRLEVNKNLALQQQLLTEEPGWKADIEGLHLPSLNSYEAEGLEVPFTVEEIHSALLDMNGDKAPGPDGLNTTFLVLIPKKGGAKDLGDFRSINLLGGLYKLVAKVLANRLKKVLGKVVSMDQNAFVRGRQILDASLIANEVLQNMGFGTRWMEWIWWCISTAKFSILVNGVSAGFFSSSKGLRQGCSLRGRGRLEMEVSHLLFADDTIIFCEAKKEYLTSLSWILAWFEAASGLRINLANSELIPIGEVEEIEEMAVALGCKVGALPSVYLGLPLGAHHKAISMWDGVEERMRRRLAL